MTSLILRTTASALQPLLLLYSLFLLTMGHDEPGGGFVGGLVAAAGVALYAIAYDVRSARVVVVAHPRTVAAVGLLLALASGIWPVMRGQALMTGQWIELPVAGLGRVALGTPVLFDAGVYLVVIGVTLLMVFALAEE